MKLVINVPDYIKEQADDGKFKEFGIPLWLAYEIANGTPLPEGLQGIYDRGYNDGEFDGYHSTLIEQGVEKSHYREVEADKGESENK